MEALSEEIKRFSFSTSDDGSGSGSGLSDRLIDGRGFGYGNGYTCDSIYGSGLGSGVGWGNGRGDGDSCGSGDSNGLGSGRGDGDGLISFNGADVSYIDGLPTVLKRAKGNIARGYIINQDLTTQKCVVAKHGNLFAHGTTIKEAETALQEKIIDNMDVDEKIGLFLQKFEHGKKYPARTFFEWHHTLTGSCEFGRKAFIANHGIDLENGAFTVDEFIDICKNEYGAEIIMRLKELWKGKRK